MLPIYLYIWLKGVQFIHQNKEIELCLGTCGVFIDIRDDPQVDRQEEEDADLAAADKIVF